MLKNITDIDEYLGSASSRFFGEGYKKVNYQINSITISDENIATKVSIHYPENWSLKKKNHQLKPHLSSIDVLLIAANICGFTLTQQLGNLNGCFINSITIIAGKNPLLDLDNVLVNFRLASKNVDDNLEEFIFKGNVGEMRVNLVIIRDKLKQNKTTDSLLESTYIDGNFKKANQEIKNILIEKDYSARANFIKNSSSVECDSVDIIDVFVSGLQLGQVLLYELDNIKRSNSNNLWMRNIKIIKKDVEAHMSENIITMLEDLHISTINNESWRSANIISKLHGIEISCSVAHQLPSGEKGDGN